MNLPGTTTLTVRSDTSRSTAPAPATPGRATRTLSSAGRVWSARIRESPQASGMSARPTWETENSGTVSPLGYTKPGSPSFFGASLRLPATARPKSKPAPRCWPSCWPCRAASASLGDSSCTSPPVGASAGAGNGRSPSTRGIFGGTRPLVGPEDDPGAELLPDFLTASTDGLSYPCRDLGAWMSGVPWLWR